MNLTYECLWQIYQNLLIDLNIVHKNEKSKKDSFFNESFSFFRVL